MIFSSQNIQTNAKTLPNFITSVVDKFVVRPTGNPNRIGVSGYIFDIIGHEEISLDSAITDHYVEDNQAIQDHIALNAEQFTLSGYVGELTYQPSHPFSAFMPILQDFENVPGVTPSFTIQAGQAYSKILYMSQKTGEAVNKAQSLYNLFSDFSTTISKQQNAFNYFYGLWSNRQLCEIETPWGIFKTMAILNIRAKQDEDTKMVTSFSITFKKIRFASNSRKTVNGLSLDSFPEGRTRQILQATPDNCGSSSGTIVDNSVLSINANALNLN